LEGGRLWIGEGFGAHVPSGGELVFNTGMTGYQEILTDPSYRRQIVVMTYPHIGNTGVNAEDVESGEVAAAGLVVRALCDTPSSWRSTGSLGAYLEQAGVPGISGVDARAITRLLRDEGAKRAVLFPVESGEPVAVQAERHLAKVPAMEGLELVSEVSVRNPYWFSEKGNGLVVAYDYGTKWNILRLVAALGFRVRVVPFDMPAEEVLKDKPTAVVLTNGPGDPATVPDAAHILAKLVGQVPLLAVCMGHQLLARALGASTYKLKFGHHGINHPVLHVPSGRVLITSQNHGFAVREKELPKDVELTFRSLNDGTLEGFESDKLRLCSVQFHPEAKPGPSDAQPLFERFFHGVMA
jgi:carbamoyl-phosphate synthase small subunit